MEKSLYFHQKFLLLIYNLKNVLTKPGVILGQDCVRLLDAALDDLFFQKFILLKAV